MEDEHSNISRYYKGEKRLIHAFNGIIDLQTGLRGDDVSVDVAILPAMPVSIEKRKEGCHSMRPA